MDIFTTALTRVVPVPIKPASLKVKALTKVAVTTAASDGTVGLEDSALYAKESSEQEKNTDNSAPAAVEASTVPADNTGQRIDVFDDSECTPAEKDDKPQLDIFV